MVGHILGNDKHHMYSMAKNSRCGECVVFRVSMRLAFAIRRRGTVKNGVQKGCVLHDFTTRGIEKVSGIAASTSEVNQ